MIISIRIWFRRISYQPQQQLIIWSRFENIMMGNQQLRILSSRKVRPSGVVFIYTHNNILGFYLGIRFEGDDP
jgi:hypothetical protein